MLVSAAKSASSILDLAASVLTFKVVRLLIVASRRFSYAPKVALNLETVSMAVSNDAKEEDARSTVATETPVDSDPSSLVEEKPILSVPESAVVSCCPSSILMAVPVSYTHLTLPTKA